VPRRFYHIPAAGHMAEKVSKQPAQWGAMEEVGTRSRRGKRFCQFDLKVTIIHQTLP
jgi:hypothetical protein